MPFYKKKNETFKTGRIDITVTIIIFTVFIIAFFFLSFKPLKNIDGEIIRSERYWRNTGDDKIPVINDFAIIGPLILLYEILLLRLEGKKRGRYLPWSLYYRMIIFTVKEKIEEGKTLTKEYLNKKKQ